MREHIQRTHGVELEKVLSKKDTRRPHAVTQDFFGRLEASAANRNRRTTRHLSDINSDIVLGVVSDDLGEQGLDNGYNLQETALPYQHDLGKLFNLASLDIRTVQDSLKDEGATIINMANHPLGTNDADTYRKLVAPKSIYNYLKYREWHHAEGIDAKAQISPATGVEPDEAADAASVIIGAGAAFIGIFGNSPYSQGKATGIKESRLSLWENMMRNSLVEGDKKVAGYPGVRFRTMAEYFNYMFGAGTGIHFVVTRGDGKTYKSIGDQILIINGNPPVLKYLEEAEWEARYLTDIQNGKNQNIVKVKPEIKHMEAMQFAQFAGARIRYGLRSEDFPLADFVNACKEPDSAGVEEIFKKHANYVYIEGRDAGSNYADRFIRDQGADIAKSVMISPSAMQAGLIQNLRESVKLLDKYGWNKLGIFRQAAIEKGLAGEVEGVSVRQVAEDFLRTASQGLSSKEQWMLAYPEFVLKTGKNGADRAIDFVESHGEGTASISELVKAREIVVL